MLLTFADGRILSMDKRTGFSVHIHQYKKKIFKKENKLWTKWTEFTYYFIRLWRVAHRCSNQRYFFVFFQNTAKPFPHALISTNHNSVSSTPDEKSPGFFDSANRMSRG